MIPASNWDELYAAGIMGIGWDNIGNVNQYDSQENIEKALQKTEGSGSTQKRGILVVAASAFGTRSPSTMPTSQPS